MCGFFEFNNHSPQGESLIRSLDIEEQSDLFRTNSGSGAASVVDIVLSDGDSRSVVPAVWWLLLDSQCPECGSGRLIIRIGELGPFLGCTNYSECNYMPDIHCPECKMGLIVRRKNHKTGEPLRVLPLP
ncbi:topoisomerase DNA-binding C4 zinc finger domain-containing protein [Amphritea sp.]|uniref:topoisomerase DNA-binding C4 zinc finger domain-containing protein n=1 Tax=Amphritea sp. TaxID=1872502 RepID=UPI003D0A3C1E